MGSSSVFLRLADAAPGVSGWSSEVCVRAGQYLCIYHFYYIYISVWKKRETARERERERETETETERERVRDRDRERERDVMHYLCLCPKNIRKANTNVVWSTAIMGTPLH